MAHFSLLLITKLNMLLNNFVILTKPISNWELNSSYTFGILNDKTTTQKSGSLFMGFNNS